MASDSSPGVGREDGARKDPIEEKGIVEDSHNSDHSCGEDRPVRQKLKETSITSAPQVSTGDLSAKEQPKEADSRSSSRGRKRSFDDDEENEMIDDESGHRRKRSRDTNYEDDSKNSSPEQPKRSDDSGRREKRRGEELADENGVSAEKSLKKKRSRDQLDKEDPKGGDSAEKAEEGKDAPESEISADKPTEGQPGKKRHRDNSQERETAPVKSAFTNISTVSPFGSLGSSNTKDTESTRSAPVTSQSAFAASSLSAFAASETSPFGSLGSTPSVFQSSTPTEPESQSEKPAATGFAAAAGPSPFAASGSSGFASLGGSGFAGFGGGFGAAAPKSGGLTSFASPGPSSLTSSSKAKPLAAGVTRASDDDGEDGGEEEADTGPKEFEQDKTDERFFAREIETGEEEEKTYFSCKAKLFQFTDKEWRERGVGTFKVNIRVKDGEEDKKTARMIMRADGVLRVMLNAPLFKGMTVGDASGSEPKSKLVHLASLENGRSVPILLRTGNEELAKELYRVVCDLLEDF